jgi:hypothetical protein
LIAALVLLTGWVVPVAVPHAADDDRACVVRQEGAESAQLGSAGAQQQPDHCLVCHAARSFRSAQHETGRIVVRLSSGLLIDTPADGFGRSSASDRLPARAPPAGTPLLVPNC